MEITDGQTQRIRGRGAARQARRRDHAVVKKKNND